MSSNRQVLVGSGGTVRDQARTAFNTVEGEEKQGTGETAADEYEGLRGEVLGAQEASKEAMRGGLDPRIYFAKRRRYKLYPPCWS